MTNDHKLGGLRQIHLLTVLEARSPKTRCQQGWFFLEALRENPFHASLLFRWLLAILGIPWLAEASPQSLLLLFHSLKLGGSFGSSSAFSCSSCSKNFEGLCNLRFEHLSLPFSTQCDIISDTHI